MLFDRDKFLRFLGSKGQHSRSNWNKICLKSTLGVDVGSTRGLLSSSEFPVCLNYHKSHKMVKLCVCLCVCHPPPSGAFCAQWTWSITPQSQCRPPRAGDGTFHTPHPFN